MCPGKKIRYFYQNLKFIHNAHRYMYIYEHNYSKADKVNHGVSGWVWLPDMSTTTAGAGELRW